MANEPMFHAYRFLVVDDAEMIRNLLKRTLRQIGCQAMDDAEDGVEAFEKLVKALATGDPYHLMFLDWNMPTLPFHYLSFLR